MHHRGQLMTMQRMNGTVPHITLRLAQGALGPVGGVGAAAAPARG